MSAYIIFACNNIRPVHENKNVFLRSVEDLGVYPTHYMIPPNILKSNETNLKPLASNLVKYI